MARQKKYSEELVEAFLNYEKVSDIMTATGLSRNTVVGYRDDPKFQAVLSQRRLLLIRQSLNQMQSSLKDCVSVLNRIIKDNTISPQVRINAIQIMMNQCKSWTETADILQRIEALENQVETDDFRG